ncbi:MAG TPA: 50S ribosomal protein L22 [bacterium]|jgi:large subunit ribosomal protein L22|nr:50S ribosomal protein L22 [bacterium]MDX9805555.1 50S ribosomal protein L22 [bacterium]HNW15775.1 50S ribosomal protein L22 [bacterium]HNZ53392.1 50S ribosomal protein L22 [bacterium]HOB70868.1 50S ribosomal protein L22 [bacterium]
MEDKIVRAQLRNFRMSASKVRLVADIIRGKSAGDAKNILEFTPRKAAMALKKLLDSAIANAENNYNLDPDTLFLKTVMVDEGQVMKRFVPRAQGRAAKILKRSSHVTIELAANK